MKKIIFLTMVLLVAPLGFSGTAAAKGSVKSKKVDCNKKTLTHELAKLDKSDANVVNISGACTEDVVVSGFKDLTLVGSGGASLTATTFVPNDPENSTTALRIDDSRVNLESLTINGGADGVACNRRSVCVFRDVIVQSGNGGITFQDQSVGDIYGASAVQNTLGLGLGIFGASKVNIRADISDYESAGPVISGNPGGGILLIDGAFLRTDHATISNNGFGVYGFRNVVVKVLNSEVNDNDFEGIAIFRVASGQIISEISNNGGDGVYIDTLSFAQIGGSEILGNGGLSVNCADSTVVVVQIGGATIDNTNCP